VQERLRRTIEAIKISGADGAILTSPDSVTYATGHIGPIEAGPSPFAGGPTTAIIGRDGAVGVVAPNLEGAAAQSSFADVTELYEGFAFEAAADLVANYRAAVERMIRRLGLTGSVAVEGSLPHSVAGLLPDARLVPVNPALARARAVKTADELARMRQAAAVTAIGQKTFAEGGFAGKSELEAFARIRTAMERAAGERLPVAGDFLSGVERTAGFSGWPIERVMQAGEPVMADLAPRVAGYWGDSCATGMLGEASPAFMRLYEAAQSTLKLAAEIIRPGLAANELDRRLREAVGRAGYAYPHHSGHSLGTAVHEWPRIVPYETAALEPGMVLMIEPGAYDPEVGGVRTEWMFEVTDDGCRVLTEFEHTPTLPL